MAQFDLDTDSGQRFQYFKSIVQDNGETVFMDPEPIEPCWVTLRLASAEKVEEMHALTRKPKVDRVLNPQSRTMERVEYYDQTPEQRIKERELIWDYAIPEWEGVLDKYGTVVECTLENKLRMMNVPIFARFVGRCLQLIGGDVAEKKEQDTKK